MTRKQQREREGWINFVVFMIIASLVLFLLCLVVFAQSGVDLTSALLFAFVVVVVFILLTSLFGLISSVY